MRRYQKKYYTPAQREWCRQYELETTFEPMMSSYETGERNFGNAMHFNLRWFEDWMHDAHHAAERHELSEDDFARRLPSKKGE